MKKIMLSVLVAVMSLAVIVITFLVLAENKSEQPIVKMDLKNISESSVIEIITEPSIDIYYVREGDTIGVYPISLLVDNNSYTITASYTDTKKQNLISTDRFTYSSNDPYTMLEKMTPVVRDGYTLYSSGRYSYVAWVISPTITSEIVTSDAEKIFSDAGVDIESVEFRISASRSAKEDGTLDPFSPVPVLN